MKNFKQDVIKEYLVMNRRSDDIGPQGVSGETPKKENLLAMTKYFTGF
jgi:hypothetical protein